MLSFTALTANLNNLTDDETRCEVSDLAVNFLRDRFDRVTLATLIRQEGDRVANLGLPLNGDGLLGYVRCRRAGSGIRLTSHDRMAVFAALAARAARP